jgi:endonuclease/exonuclease/phosphatase (EEP) superfamily protein YafD
VGEHAARGAGSGALRWVAALVVVLLIGGLLIRDALAPEPAGQAQDAAQDAETTTEPTASPTDTPSEPPQPPQQVVRGDLLLVEPKPKQPAPPPPPELGTVTTAVANIPNRTGNGPFASSMGTLVSAAPDFVLLNEVSRHGTDELRALAPGYDAYREEQRDDTLGGGSQSMNNVVLWRAEDWSLVDAGRIKLVDDDRGFRLGKAYVWDRYATWTTLRRPNGAVVSVVSTHLMTNPARYPQQHGNPRMSRAEQYGRGMDVLLDLVGDLSASGPVLVGGDMNTHGREGPWAAASRMSAAGFGYAKDNAVMYVFYPSGVEVVNHRQVGVASDHPAIVTTLDLAGAA